MNYIRKEEDCLWIGELKQGSEKSLSSLFLNKIKMNNCNLEVIWTNIISYLCKGLLFILSPIIRVLEKSEVKDER